jgi:hypothetical protein
MARNGPWLAVSIDHERIQYSPASDPALPAALALQLPFARLSESMGNHDSNIVDADSVD